MKTNSHASIAQQVEHHAVILKNGVLRDTDKSQDRDVRVGGSRSPLHRINVQSACGKEASATRIVGGALFQKGKLLVVKRTKERVLWPNLWEIPGGRVEGNESDEEALVREFLEETELQIRIIKKYNEFYYKYAGKDSVESDFIIQADSFAVKIDPNEHTEYRWITKDELRSLEISPDMRKSIEKAFEVN
ncbi:MAG: NUDIX domain-containing protein [Candidatus Aenigmarchaeota archaeon]|nr:NUDIX domain-containing protein [Candidatus Aenigmarchaeota archaeon]